MSIESSFVLDPGKTLTPYSSDNNLIKHQVILFPEKPEEYGTKQELVDHIQTFIHRYVDLSAVFEIIATYYILLSWVYDRFNELPYLRVRGDYGGGKTRFLLIVGSLCYKGAFASGASSVSPLFHILDSFRGTLIMDESDFRFSDEKAEIVKILNNGNVKGFPVLRSEVNRYKEFNPRAFNVYGPKILATRGYYDDKALEAVSLQKTWDRDLSAKTSPSVYQTAGRKRLGQSVTSCSCIGFDMGQRALWALISIT